MSQIEITTQAWQVVLLYALALTMLILIIAVCIRRVVSSARHNWETQADARATKRRSQEIRAIGRSARQNMQELYDDYLTQVTQSRRR